MSVDPKQGPLNTIPPTVECPTCFAYLYVTDSMCWRCEELFKPRELWDRWEAAKYR